MASPATISQAEARRIANAVGVAVGRVQSAQALPTSLLAWAQQNRQIEGQPFSLVGWEPLRALYEDTHPRIVVIKPSQRGISEYAVCMATFALDVGAQVWANNKRGLNVAYLFPTVEALGDFSKERLSSLKRETSHLSAIFADNEFDGVRFKQVGDSYLYLRGAWSESALLSFAADVLILDEFDRMSRKAVALARKRLNASVVRREVAISTPTIPGRGIDLYYKQSDMRVYEQLCPNCEEWTTFDFFRDIRVDGMNYREFRYDTQVDQILSANVALSCPNCDYEWTEYDRVRAGRWRAENPEVKNLRGYHIPPFAFAVADLPAMAAASISNDPSEIEEFFRSDLGLPYEPAGARITHAMLDLMDAGQLPAKEKWQGATMGADVGSRIHFRVSAKTRKGETYVLECGSVHSFEDLDGLMQRYKIVRCVIDAMPEQHSTAAFAARHPGKVYRAFYPMASAMSGQMVRVDEGKGIVQINRTMALDALYAVIANQAEKWPTNVLSHPETAPHLMAMVRVTSTDSRGQPVAEWVHSGPDHMAHAFLYDIIARATMPAPAFIAIL